MAIPLKGKIDGQYQRHLRKVAEGIRRQRRELSERPDESSGVDQEYLQELLQEAVDFNQRREELFHRPATSTDGDGVYLAELSPESQAFRDKLRAEAEAFRARAMAFLRDGSSTDR